MRSFQDYLIIDGVAVPFEPSESTTATVIVGDADVVFYATSNLKARWGGRWSSSGQTEGPTAGFNAVDYTVNGAVTKLNVWSIAIQPGKPVWMSFNGAETQWSYQVRFEYRQQKPTGPALAYIPATSEPGVPSGDNPVAFAPLLKAEGIGFARIWTDLLASYGGIDAWAAAGIKPIVTTTFKEGNYTAAQSCPPNVYVASMTTTVQRLKNAAIVQFWNEAQFGKYGPNDYDIQTTAGLRRVFTDYYLPLAQAIGKDRMAGPSVLPHFEGARWLRMLVDAGFYDPALTSYADFHLYFGRWSSKQQVIDTVSECKAILPAGIKIISTEFGKDVNDRDLDYATGNLQEIYATYATLGISPMAHFMGGTMAKFAAHTKGIYSRDGKRINADVRGVLAKVNSGVMAAGSVS